MKNFSDIEAAVVHGETGSKIKGELTCVQCGTTKILEVEVEDNHNRIYYHLCCLNFYHGEAPKIWMKPRLDQRCPSCKQCHMDPKQANKKNINWPFLYLIEALGYLSLEDLKYYCKQNNLWDKGKNNEQILFEVFSHMSQKIQEWLSIHEGKNIKNYDSLDDTEAQTDKVLIAEEKWSYPPEELLQLVFKCPTMDVADLQRCHDVCVSWRSVVKKLLSYKGCPPMLPSFLYFPNKTSSCCKPSSCYDTNATEFYRLGFPFTYCERLFMYSSRGWLLSVGENILSMDLQLLNPLSGVKIQLPVAPRHFSRPHKFILSDSPCNRNCIIALLCGSKRELAFYKSCYESESFNGWTYMFLHKRHCEDLIYFDDKFLGIDCDGNLFTFPTNSGSCKWKISTSIGHPKNCHRYLVNSSHGDLLMVVRHVLWEKKSLNTSIYKTTSFEVFKLDATKNEWRKNEWSNVTSLGDEALFLTHNDSSIVSASDPTVCKRNCIYFVDDSLEGYCVSRGTDFGVFDMESKTIMRFCSVPFNRWFKPDI